MENFKEFLRTAWGGIILVVLFVLLLVDIIGADRSPTTGNVVDKVFVPEVDYWTLEVVTHTNGKSVYTTLENRHVYHPPEWHLHVALDFEDETINTNCTADRFHRTNVGNRVNVNRFYGKFTGINWKSEVVE